jgi:hypothetical protein
MVGGTTVQDKKLEGKRGILRWWGKSSGEEPNIKAGIQHLPLAVWQGLLSFAVEQRVDALVDCGALLAGASNRLVSAQC